MSEIPVPPEGAGKIESPPPGGGAEPSFASRLALAQKAGGLVVPLLTTVLAFLIGGLVVLITGHNPITAYRAIFNGTGFNWLFPWVTGEERRIAAKDLQAPYDVVKDVAANGKLPVVNFVAGGISTPADAALVMQLGAEGVFVGSGIFKSEDPARMANAIVQATTHFDDPKILADVSKGLGAPMRGLAMEAIPAEERLAVRGW